jgi:Pao retrotransposon peptidase.
MDDFVAGAPDENSIVKLYYELVALMKQLSLPMAKWATNSTQLTDIWHAERRQVTLETHVLGVPWNTATDELSLAQPDINDGMTFVTTTKRQLLKATSRFYDPLGLATPISVVSKILFQETWNRGLQWNELLPADLAKRWAVWTSTLHELPTITIPRFIGAS